MQVRAFIEQKGFDALTTELGIKVKHYPGEGLTVLNYDQIGSPKAHPVVIECRGLILYTATLAVAARAFDRFFNHGEVPDITGTIDFSRSKVYEKADGSLIKVYHCSTTGRWEISTRGTAFAESGNDILPRFRDGVLRAFSTTEDEFQTRMSVLPKNCTYIFEYVAPENRIVTPYEQPEMILIGIVDIEAGKDLFHGDVEPFVGRFSEAGLPCRMARAYDLSVEDEIVEAASSLGGLQEGFVVRDMATGVRTKIKSITYVKVHAIKGEGPLTPKRAAEVALEGEKDEYLTYFPEDKPLFDQVQAALDALIEDVKSAWAPVKHIEDQKEFAMAVKGSRFSGVLFSTKKSQAKDPKAIFESLRAALKLEMVLEKFETAN